MGETENDAASLLHTEAGLPASSVLCDYTVWVPLEPVSIKIDDFGEPCVWFPHAPKGVPDIDRDERALAKVDAVKALIGLLSIQSEGDVIKFAQQYGPLWSCSTHNGLGCYFNPYPDPNIHSLGPDRCTWDNSEPVAAWRALRDTIRTILAARVRLQEGESVTIGEACGTEQKQLKFEVSAAEANYWLTKTISRQLMQFAFTPVLTDEYEFVLHSGLGVVPLLWLQVASACAGTTPLAICSVCAMPYIRQQRASRREQHNYCPRCNTPTMRKRMSRKAKKRPPHSLPCRTHVARSCRHPAGTAVTHWN